MGVWVASSGSREGVEGGDEKDEVDVGDGDEPSRSVALGAGSR